MAQQYRINKRIEKFGKEGKEAVTKVLTQLHRMKTWKLCNAKKLT